MKLERTSLDDELLSLEDEELRAFLWEMKEALDIWLHTFAGELCDEATVEESCKKLMRGGGTLYYIAIKQEKINKLLGI